MAKYSYNGVVLWERPTTSGYQIIYSGSDGLYYLAISSSPFTLHGSNLCFNGGSFVNGYATIATASKWVLGSLEDEAVDFIIIASSNQFVWANHDIHSLTDDGGTLTDSGVAYRATEPVLQEEKRVLKALANKYTANTYGATGIYVGAQVLDTATGRVTDISNEATYSFDAFQSPYAYLDENRQLFVSEDFPFTGVGIIVTWDELPGQKATVPVFLEIESGEPEGGGGGGGYYPGGDDIIIDTSAVTDIIVSIIPMEVTPGGHAFFEVLVTGTGNYSGEYTLELNGQESPDTYFTKGSGVGNIWIAEDETADFVLLTATSVENPLIQTTEMLYIDQTAVVDPVATADQLQRAYMQGYATAKAYLGKLKIVEGTVLSVDQTDTEEAPEDIPSQLKRAFMQGFMSGVGSLASKGKLECKEPEPVAYLYNDVRLPKLPELTVEQKAKYRYIILGDGKYVLYTQSKNHLKIVDDSGKYFVGVEPGESFLIAVYSVLGSGEFTDPMERTFDSYFTFTRNVTWSNYDILNADGSLYLAASEPVPVYE